MTLRNSFDASETTESNLPASLRPALKKIDAAVAEATARGEYSVLVVTDESWWAIITDKELQQALEYTVAKEGYTWELAFGGVRISWF